METWRNGEKAENVRQIIARNFNILEGYLPNSILALSTQKRQLLSTEYLKSGLIVFDTDLQCWLKYNGKGWESTTFPNEGYAREINTSDWNSNKEIKIPFSEHLTPNPSVQLYMLNNNVCSSVLGGVSVDSEFNINLSSDLTFSGKVVIK